MPRLHAGNPRSVSAGTRAARHVWLEPGPRRAGLWARPGVCRPGLLRPGRGDAAAGSGAGHPPEPARPSPHLPTLLLPPAAGRSTSSVSVAEDRGRERRHRAACALMAGVCAQQAQQAGAYGGAQQQQQVTLPRCSLLMPTSPDHGSHVPASSLRCARSCMLAADGGLRCGVVQTAAYSGYPAATPVQGMNSAAGNQGYAATSYGTSQQGYASAQVCCARQLIRSPGRRCDGCMRARRGTSYREGVAGQEQEQCLVKRLMCRLRQCPALLPIPMPCAARRAILASDFPLRHHVDGTRSTAALRHSREPCTLEVRLRGRVMHGRPAAGA